MAVSQCLASCQTFVSLCWTTITSLDAAVRNMTLCLGVSQVLEGGRYKDRDELAKVFANAGVDIKTPIVASCGTGVTASVLALALHHLSPKTQVWKWMSPVSWHVKVMQMLCLVRHVHCLRFIRTSCDIDEDALASYI